MDFHSKPRVRLARVPPAGQRTPVQQRVLNNQIFRLNTERNVIADEIEAIEDEKWQISNEAKSDSRKDISAMILRRKRWDALDTLHNEKIKLANQKYQERVSLQHAEQHGLNWDDDLPQAAHPPGPPFVNPDAYA
jgi:glutamate/tyrosine decarboxylase-like PLP-dependent enzyme